LRKRARDRAVFFFPLAGSGLRLSTISAFQCYFRTRMRLKSLVLSTIQIPQMPEPDEQWRILSAVMAGLVPAIHVFGAANTKARRGWPA
jgi:hypothetical protein